LKRKNLKKKKKPFKNIIFLIIIILGCIPLFFNELGIFKWYQLKKERYQMQAEIDNLILKEKKLLKKLYLLENDDNYIKQIAREQFHMVKPGEKNFQVIDKRKIKNK